MSNIVAIETGKTDKEVAEDYKKKIIDAYEPLLKILNDANKDGFAINVGCGPTPLGIQILQLQVSKVY